MSIHGKSAALLLKMERKHDHLAGSLFHRLGIHHHVLVLQFVGMSGVETVAQAITELEFRAQFEERQIEVAPHSHLKK